MKTLKFFLIVVILGSGILAEEAHRTGRCNKNSPKEPQKFNNKPNNAQLRKPYPLVRQHEGHKFHGKNEFPSKPYSDASSHAASNVNNKNTLSKPKYPVNVPVEDDKISFNMYTDQLVADPEDIPSTFGISPRLNISPDGKVSFARSMKFENQQQFHDDSAESSHSHEHMDEDHDHFHKIRTARGAPPPKNNIGPQLLTSTLGNLHAIAAAAQTLQATDVSQGAQGGDYMLLNASGTSINATNEGTSSATGNGTISSSGTTTVSNSNNNGSEQ